MNKQMPGDDRYTDAPADIAAEMERSVPIADDFPSPEELRRELKRTVTIRLDPEVYAWFQLPGPGYQTRINAVLRYYVEHQKAGRTLARPVLRMAAAKKRDKPRKAAAHRKPAKKSFGQRMKDARAKARKKRTPA
jgi:uncharacterized protein (DUF4415 family)